MRKPQLPPGTIPAGATHFYHNPERDQVSTSPWRKCVEGQWYMFKEDRWEKIGSTKVHLFVKIADVLKQEKEWDGDGLPMIGSLVEFDIGGGKWVAVTVFAIKDSYDHAIDILFDGPEGWGVVPRDSTRLRPVKSAADIEKENILNEIASVISRSKLTGVAPEQALYDAGFRRHSANEHHKETKRQ